jgi:ribose transport system permease protein
MENQVKTSTENKEQQLKKLSKMTMIRSLLPIAGLIIIFQCPDEFPDDE